MANAVRPLLRSSNERQTRLNFLPVSRDDDHQHAHLQRTPSNNNTNTVNNVTTPVATRRSSRSDPLLARPDDSSKERPPTPARTHSSRKRPAAALNDDNDADADADADATETRPPTKITVTRPHGELVRITNGVPVPLDMHADDVPSARSTPRPGSSSEKLAAPPAVAPAPASTASSQDKRSLRSHDGGSRLKSDLAVYFCNYDDIIAGVTKEADFLQPNTPIYIVDEPLRPKSPLPVTPDPSPSAASPTRSRKAQPSSPSSPAPTSAPTLAPAQSSTTFRVFDYATEAKAVHYNHGEDPLADAVYFTQHRRAERKEKQLRNIEKERAMHEKVQLERLLDGLQGPDWLKVMGITGVTDGERKDWEAKRDYFVKEVEALVDKFRVWKEEEKRLRAEKEAALAAREEDEDEDGEETEDTDSITVNGRDPPPPRQQQHKEPEPPKPRRPPRPHGFLLPLLAPEPAVPFQSFYAKPHLRAAALGKQRHGRNASAFGHPVPDFAEKEFELPDEFIDPQFLRDNARQRRRRKRESGVNVTSSNPG